MEAVHTTEQLDTHAARPEGSIEGNIIAIYVSHGGVPKRQIAEAHVTIQGIVGDAHDDTRHHGGPARALCIFTLEQIQRLHSEGHPIAPGNAGENLTLAGIPLAMLVPGVQLELGAEVLAEITNYTSPCSKNARWFLNGDFSRMSQKLHPGESRVYARVLRTGILRPGDRARLLPARTTQPALWNEQA